MKSRIHYTKPSITDLEVRYAADAATQGWGEDYASIERFMTQHAYISKWGRQFVTLVPEIRSHHRKAKGYL